MAADKDAPPLFSGTMPAAEEDASLPSRRVRPGGVNLEVSRLGLGTATLMSRVGRRTSLALLGAALDAGITHFDTARSYGFGEAEAVLGEFLQKRRQELTVTTKVGILPPRRRAWLSVAKAGARGMISAIPAARAAVRHQAARMLPAARFGDASITASFEASLRELRTDFVDFLLLHEPHVEVLRSGEALAFLERMQREGKTRYFGVATDDAEVIAASSTQRARGYLLQRRQNLVESGQAAGGTPDREAALVYGCLGEPFAALGRSLAAEASTAARWSRVLGVDVCAPGVLSRLTLQATMAAVPGAAVLFASTSPAHVQENAAALRTAASRQQRETFLRLVREHAEGAGI